MDHWGRSGQLAAQTLWLIGLITLYSASCVVVEGVDSTEYTLVMFVVRWLTESLNKLISIFIYLKLTRINWETEFRGSTENGRAREGERLPIPLTDRQLIASPRADAVLELYYL